MYEFRTLHCNIYNIASPYSHSYQTERNTFIHWRESLSEGIYCAASVRRGCFWFVAFVMVTRSEHWAQINMPPLITKKLWTSWWSMNCRHSIYLYTPNVEIPSGYGLQSHSNSVAFLSALQPSALWTCCTLFPLSVSLVALFKHLDPSALQ